MQDLTLKTEPPWHSEPAEAALERLKSSNKGLSADEACKAARDGRAEPPAGG